ncbi:DNA repair protein RecO [Kribbella qitaiheensis]|uniref:DNA repair protein RecO n=1 Tax=Kribbella qitaiheensis TaxID=1544730 RepID=A0A7G6X664_9ACTN|nr:DNA repair protein RecO [Kribbella qitaiheensis]QNE21729.1 DNA repair protein RecO [Kribbella qitaiheensis]
MPLYRDEAIVLRTQKLGEADRIATLLTRTHGKIRAVAKGVRRTSSRFGARLEPFSHVDLQLATGRTLDVVTQAVSISAYGEGIVNDYARYTTGTVLLETADRLVVEEKEPATQQHLLLAGALRVLSTGEREPALILDSFLLRSLAISGYAPSFADCAKCGEEGPHRAFNPAAGGVVCSTCRPPASAMPAPTTIALLSALLTGDWPTAQQSDPRARREANTLVAAFVAYHLDRNLRSLPYLDLTPDPATS